MTDTPDRLTKALKGRYRIERELGHGGMATAYLAHDRKHDRPVALKVLRPELAAALGPERFLREITTTASLRHPHILPLYDSGEAGGFLYYVMPYVAGGTLRDRLDREQQLPLDDVLEITREVADALTFAHAHDVIHRDIKPENILLESGHAVVADFGIAKAVSVAGGETLTDTGIAVGTPAYMSPEQAAGAKYLDGRSDLYSLGCVVYELLAGEPPFTGPTVQAILARRLTDPVRPLRTVRSSVPVGVEQAIERALAKVPADRFATVTQFAEALSRPGGAVTPPRRIRPRVVALAAVVLALGGVAALLLRPRPFALTTANATPITSDPGIEFQPALSPDGKQVAFLAKAGITVSRTVAIGGGGELHPIEGVAGTQQYPSWSPDGEFLRFWSCEDTTCSWKEVGRLGGPPRGLDLPFQTPRLAWSGDGARAAYVRQDSIFLYSVKDRATRLLLVHPNSNGIHSLAWSPDGRRLAYVSGNLFWPDKFNLSSSSIWIVAADGRRVAATDESHLNVSPAWFDDRHLLFVSDREGQREIYVVEVDESGPRGEPQRLPGGTDAHSISISADGSRLAFAKYSARQNVWAYPTGSLRPLSIKEGRPVTFGTQVVEAHDVSRDGQWLVYDSNLGANSGGGSQIFKLRLGGGTPMLVASVGAGAQWSPDGREIAYQKAGYWVALADGTGAMQLTHPPNRGYDGFAFWSPDGMRLAFWSSRSGRFETWLLTRARIGAPWSEPMQLTDFGCAFSAWTTDGRGILCRSEPDEKALVLVSLSGEVRWRRDMSAAGFTGGMPVASPDGSTLYMEKTGGTGSGIWAWPVAGGPSRLVVSYDDPSLAASTWRGALNVTRDRLFVTVSQSESDIWVMDLKRSKDAQP
jgi:Tol biopolymer transport system component